MIVEASTRATTAARGRAVLAAAVQDALEPLLAAGAEDGGDMAVGPGALDAQELGSVLDGEAALEDGAEAVDDLGRERGEVGEGLLADALALYPSLAEQDGGFARTVGNATDVEGHGRVLWEHFRQCIRS